MLVGILSDSHGRSAMVAKAMALFDELGVSHVIHCGDVGDENVVDEFVGRPMTFVWGNTDLPTPGILAYVESVGLPVPEEVPVTVELGGKRFAVFHGHEPGFTAALDALDVDYILHGHSHVRRDERIGSRRIINPGALHRAAVKTVATLDTKTDALTFHEVNG